jgi:hypothetical protein
VDARSHNAPRPGFFGPDVSTGTALVSTAAALAALPFLVAAVRAIGWDWTPTGDEGVIASRAFDVLTSKPPLLGQFSQASAVVGQPTYSPGPLSYWALAFPAHLGPAALVITTALINVTSVIATVALARRRGGIALALAVALGLVLVTGSLSREAPYAIWNPFAVLYPFTLLLFVAWSVACGELALLPLLVLLASFTVQGHLSYALPALGAVLVAAAGASRARRHRRIAAFWSPARWVLLAALLGVVAWSAPLVEQARHRPGNLVLIARAVSADRERMGMRAGARAVVRAVGVRPWWLRDGRELNRFHEVIRDPGAGRIASAVLVLGGVVLALALGIRRRREDVVAAAALSLWLCGSMALSTSSVPAEQGDTLAYGLFWTSPGAMFVWVTTGWSLGVLLAAGRSPSTRGLAAAAGLALVAMAVTGAWVVTGQRRANGGASLRFGSQIERVAAALPAHTAVDVDARDDRPGRLVVPAITYALRRNGSRVSMPKPYADYFGQRYRRARVRADWRLRVLAPGVPAGDAQRVVDVGGAASVAVVRPG